MHTKRQQRIGEQIQRELAQVLLRHPEKPLFTKVTVVGAEVSADMAYAKIFISVFDETQAKVAVQILQNNAGFLRKEIAQSLNLRITPILSFIYDESIKHGQKIDELINEAIARDEINHANETEK